MDFMPQKIHLRKPVPASPALKPVDATAAVTSSPPTTTTSSTSLPIRSLPKTPRLAAGSTTLASASTSTSTSTSASSPSHRRSTSTTLSNLRALSNANAPLNPLRVERLTRAKSAYWSKDKPKMSETMEGENLAGSMDEGERLEGSEVQNDGQGDAAPAELSAVVDELLSGLGAKFEGVSREIFAKIDDMSRRLDNLEATIQASGEGSSNNK